MRYDNDIISNYVDKDKVNVFLVDFDIADNSDKGITDCFVMNIIQRNFFNQNGEYVMPRVPVSRNIEKFMDNAAITNAQLRQGHSDNKVEEESLFSLDLLIIQREQVVLRYLLLTIV